jgi:NAD(P)-dependent dehydrogenase (short-subunit alcohol dehydrogenase family)
LAPHTRDKLAIITGACGGMGRAISRFLGRGMKLVLTDTDADALAPESQILKAAGFDVAAVLRCDVADPADLQILLNQSASLGPLGALVHTAGLSPALSNPSRIIAVNLRGTAQLLETMIALAVPGSVAICIASMAAYLCPADAALDAALDDPAGAGLMRKLRHVAARLPGGTLGDEIEPHLAYAMSKRGVVRMCEQRSALWAQKGARLISVSPGMIDTPMGRKEVAQNPKAAALLEITPMQRWGTPSDIAHAVAFLCSAEAGFITGCDLRIDGGLTPIVARQNGQD